MGLLVNTFLIAAAVAAPRCESPIETEFRSAQIHMGVSFKIVLYAPDEETANRGFQAAFKRIEQLDRIMSDYDALSELSRLSAAAPSQRPIAVSDDLFEVLQLAVQMSKRSGGAFDVTAGPLTKLWRRALRQKQLPSQRRLAEACAAVGYQSLRLDPHEKTVELLLARMRLDLGGIAKGYAAERALAELRQLGLSRALVNGSGDMAIGDPPPGRAGWKIGVAPQGPAAEPGQFLTLAGCGVATSGDAWQFVEIDGKRYSHIIDPRTAMSLTDHSGVSVVAPNCTLADSLASAVSVLGPVEGMRLVEATNGAAAMIVRLENDKVTTYRSDRWQRFGAPPDPAD